MILPLFGSPSKHYSSVCRQIRVNTPGKAGSRRAALNPELFELSVRERVLGSCMYLLAMN